jgi:antitoxin MazE
MLPGTALAHYFSEDDVPTASAERRMIYNYRCISSARRALVQVAKWGNSLAVRLPAAVVDALELKEGDQIEIRVAGDREFEVRRDRSRQKALERLRRLRRPLPPGFTFDRDDANER